MKGPRQFFKIDGAELYRQVRANRVAEQSMRVDILGSTLFWGGR